MEILEYDFMINAIISCVLASIAFGIVGSFVVVKRIVFVTGGIAHSAFGGIGLAYFLGFSPMIGALGVAILSASIISYLKNLHFQNENILIGILWSFGMAMGIIFIDLTPGYVPNLIGFLFGNLLTITRSELLFLLILDVIVLGSSVVFFKEFQAVSFDEEFMQVIGLPVKLLNLLLFIIIGLSVITLVKLVGIILVITLMIIPPSISLKYVKSLKSVIVLSILLGVFITLSGLLLSYALNLSSGAVIIIFSVFVYITSSIVFSVRQKLIINKNRI